jgi:hypothetical protein
LSDELIEAGNFEVGESDKYIFIPMRLPANEKIDFIQKEWDELGKTPNIGDVCWFRATPAGKNSHKN